MALDTEDGSEPIVEEEIVDRGDGAGDDDAGETAEAKVAREAEEAAAAAAAKDKGIPKARFDEAVKKERDRATKAEERARGLEAKLKSKDTGLDPAVVEKEIAELEEKLDQAIADGDAAAKKSIRAEIRAKTTALADANAEARASYATAVAVERVRYDAQVALLETQYPAMNPDDDSYDEELVAELTELKGAYEATGMGSTDALKKAAKYVFKTAPAEVKGKAKEGEDEVDEGATPEEKQKAAEAAAKRKEEAIKAGIAAKGKQPPNTDKSGKASDKKGGALDASNVGKMTDTDFAKLSKDDLARMRGDTV
jgi:hypothetical protein